MMRAVMVLCLAAELTEGSSHAEPGWHVGWGFESLGGFPPIPWRTWSLNKSAVVYVRGVKTTGIWALVCVPFGPMQCRLGAAPPSTFYPLLVALLTRTYTHTHAYTHTRTSKVQ